jgi:thiamine biosynthesis protein ThiI
MEQPPKYVALISGGIDSPVAAHLMLSRGAELVLVHFDNRPFTDDAEVEKVRRLVDRLRELHGEMPALLVPHGETAQLAVARGAVRRLGCVLCRRMMFRVASAIAKREGAQGLVTGESLGQVASQTLANIRAESGALGGVPAVRPLIGLDKQDIIKVAKDIGTFDISTSSGLCCTIVPDKPSVAARPTEVEAEEEGLDAEALVKAALEGARQW